MREKFNTFLNTKRQRNILIVLMFMLLCGIGYLFNRNSKLQMNLNVSNQNIKALTDSVRVSKNKNGDLEYSKNILVSEKNDLKSLNKDLSNELEKEKGKIFEITKFVNTITIDTLYLTNTVIKYNDGSNGLKWTYDTIYDSENERHLAGVSNFIIDTNGYIIPLATLITTDDIKFNIITGLRESNGNIEVFVRSNYPNFVTNDLSSAIIDPHKHPVLKKFTKPKRWGIGPYGGFGLGTNIFPHTNIGVGFSFGIGIQYSFIRF